MIAKMLPVPLSFIILRLQCTMISYQGCALAEPSGPWHPTVALGWQDNLSFFIQIMCWAPYILQVQSTGLPSIFLTAQTFLSYRMLSCLPVWFSLICPLSCTVLLVLRLSQLEHCGHTVMAFNIFQKVNALICLQWNTDNTRETIPCLLRNIWPKWVCSAEYGF